MSTRKGVFNTLVGVIMTIIISVFQFTFLFVINTHYEGEFVGLIRVIVSFLAYLSLAEGGLGIITMFSLYRPLQNGDYDMVNDIVNTTRKKYQHTGKIYLAIVISIAFLIALWRGLSPEIFLGLNIDIAFWELALVILCLSSKELIFFYFSGAYQNLIQADQKGYLNRLVFIFSEIIMYILLISLFLVPNMPFFVPFFAYLVCAVIKTGVTYIIIKIEYPWLQHKKWIKQKRLLKQSWWVTLSRLPELLISNIDVILVTIFLSLSFTTVYSYYLIIAATIRTIALILISSFREAFGYWIAKSGRIRWSTYTRFEMYAYMVAAFCFILQFVISQYLISSIYGNQYINVASQENSKIFFDFFLSSPTFILFLSLKNAVEVATEPGKVIVNATVKHKETIWGSYIQVLIVLGLGISLGWSLSATGYRHWALYMIMFSGFLGWVYRLISIWFYVWKNLTYNSDLRYIVQNTLILILPMIITILFAYLYLFNTFPPVNNISKPTLTLTIVGYAFLGSIGLVLVLSMVINFKQFWMIFNLKNFFKSLFHNKKAKDKKYDQELQELFKNELPSQMNTFSQTFDLTTTYQFNRNNIDDLLEQELYQKQKMANKKKSESEKPKVGIYKIRG